MNMSRRDALTGMAAALGTLGISSRHSAGDGVEMYGLIGQATAVAGKRDDLIAILIGGVGSMPGCLSYIVAKDTTDADSLWITEVWDSKESHDASLSLPEVKAAIAKGKPLFANFGPHFVTTPVGGHGLASPKV
jgi:quinol monooxygenase YgiN